MEFYTCKNCGEDIEIENGQKTVVCDFCGMEQTLPKLDDPKKLEMLLNANDHRIRCRFDLAKKMYEQVIERYPDDNEAYWCKLLCEYGIEYVEDDLTEKNVPTCHRTVAESIFDNADYRFIMSRASADERRIYEAEATEIDRIQKDIISKARNAESYDIFICYKESDLESRKRTLDSQYATKIYTHLTNNGYKVFFSRVTLNQMMGSEYEPVIYSALKSAKVMLHVTTSEAHTNSPWVRNEWSRYLEFMREDNDKVIMPCIARMDPYDLPEELAEYQVALMTDLDFIENLLRQINSKFGRIPMYGMPHVMPTPPPPPQPPAPTINPQIANSITRAKLFVEDGDWENANKYAESCLDVDCECADAYAVKLMCDFKVNVLHKLVKNGDFLTNRNYVKAMRFASGELKTKLADLESEYWMDKAELASDKELYDDEFYNTVTKKLKVLGSYMGADKVLSGLEERRGSSEKRGLVVDLIRILEAIPDIGKGEDLQMKLSADKTYYIVKGVVDENIKQCVIPRKYKGIPVKEIASEAFSKCKNLESVEIGDDVTKIGSRAFYNCARLQRVIIPSGVTSIGNCAFCKTGGPIVYCEAESEPSGWDANWHSGQSGIWGYGGENGRTYDGWCWCTTLDGAVTIAKYTGYNTEIDVPAIINGRTVTGIGGSAFSYCRNITSVTLPDSIVSIGAYAFAYCDKIQSIALGKNSQLVSIGCRAFYGCRAITCLMLPESVESIEKEAFFNCSKIVIYSEAKSKPSGWKYDWNYSNYPVIWDCKRNNVAVDGYTYGITVDGINYAVKDDEAKVVGTNASDGVIIPSTIRYNFKTYSVTAIGENAFTECAYLTNVKIPDSIVNIGSFAFYNCLSLTSIEIPDSVTSIGSYAFNFCTSLTSIEIPHSVISIRNWAFSSCTKLTIYCEAVRKPSGWGNDWNYSQCPVVWGHKK